MLPFLRGELCETGLFKCVGRQRPRWAVFHGISNMPCFLVRKFLVIERSVSTISQGVWFSVMARLDNEMNQFNSDREFHGKGTKVLDEESERAEMRMRQNRATLAPADIVDDPVIETTVNRNKAIAAAKRAEHRLCALERELQETRDSSARELAVLTGELEKLHAEAKSLRKEIRIHEKRQERMAKLETELAAVKGSFAWKITFPLRAICRIFRRDGQTRPDAEPKEKTPAEGPGPDDRPLSFSRQLKLVVRSKQIHPRWYLEKYPDVKLAGLEPAEHYLKYGARLGRNPGRGFDTRFYLERYSDVANSGMNPLVHYVLHGKGEGRKRKPGKTDLWALARKEVAIARHKVLTLGFNGEPLEELQGILETSPNPISQAMAARDLALWHLRMSTPHARATVLEYLGKAWERAPDQGFRSQLATIRLLCHFRFGDEEEGCIFYEQAGRSGEISPDALLAWGNYQATPEKRCVIINQVLKDLSMSPVGLLSDKALTPFDRLESAGCQSGSSKTEGPWVTVLIAARDAAKMGAACPRFLQDQTWRNVEVLVVDDSRSDLNQARGEYVIGYEADDWWHPMKIESHVRYLEANPDVMGCTSREVRVSSELRFRQLNVDGGFMTTGHSSCMFRRSAFLGVFSSRGIRGIPVAGDIVADFRKTFGQKSVADLLTGPLSFARDVPLSREIDCGPGMQSRFRESDPERWPVPGLIGLGNSRTPTRSHYSVILASDFRLYGGSSHSNAQELLCQKQAGITTAIFPMFRYDFNDRQRPFFSAIQHEIDLNETDILIPNSGEVSCDLLLLRYPPILQHRQSQVPRIKARAVKVIVNQPPMSDYSSNGVLRYDLGRCAENVRFYFGQDAEWHPIGPLVREALHENHAQDLHHIRLSDEDWHNIIDINSWRRGPRRRGRGDKLRIGRHSRDSFVKWPPTKESILAAYPADDDVEIHVLGGAEAPKELIGEMPANWIVHAFGAMEPKEFLAGIDVFIYFTHPDWVESFGRTIIEAMAAGVPVVLPEIYRPLFEESAIYATPETAAEEARRLYHDPVAYDAQVEKASRYVARNFSYELHVERLRALGVELCASLAL